MGYSKFDLRHQFSLATIWAGLVHHPELLNFTKQNRNKYSKVNVQRDMHIIFLKKFEFDATLILAGISAGINIISAKFNIIYAEKKNKLSSS